MTAPDVLFANKLRLGVRIEKAFQAGETACTNAPEQYMVREKHKPVGLVYGVQSKGLVVDLESEARVWRALE